MKRTITLLSLFALILSISSCGNSSNRLVTDLGVETRDQDNAKFVTADFKLNIGETQMPFLHLPLPKDYGYLRTFVLNGDNYVAVDVNLTEVLKLPGGPAQLPNGTMVPVDTMGAGIIQIDVPGINGRVYVSQKDDMTLVGFAFSIKQLDGLGSSIGTIGVFPIFQIGEVSLTAGLFAGEGSKETGLAAFANLGGLWNYQGEKITNIPYRADAFEFKQGKRVPRWKARRMFRYLNRLKNTQQTLEIH
jgi:hypothetical protein